MIVVTSIKNTNQPRNDKIWYLNVDAEARQDEEP